MQLPIQIVYTYISVDLKNEGISARYAKIAREEHSVKKYWGEHSMVWLDRCYVGGKALLGRCSSGASLAGGWLGLVRSGAIQYLVLEEIKQNHKNPIATN